MILSVDIYALREKIGDLDAIPLIKEAGFDGIDYSFYWTKEGSPILGDAYEQYAETVRKCLDEHGLVCNQAHAPFELRYGEKFDASEPHYLEIIRSIKAASILGAENIIVHSIEVPLSENFEEYNIQFYKSLEPYCEKYSVRVAVENLFSYNGKTKSYFGRLHTPQLLCDFIKKLNSPWFVACLDVGHAAITGTEPEDFIMEMDSGLLKALHIQDTDYFSDCHVLPFMGSLNWDSIISALKKTNYCGELTFEVFRFLKRQPNAMILDALKYTASIGRYLISKFK